MNLRINADELLLRLNNNEVVNILDVREPIEYHSYNIGGQNIAVNKLQQNLQQLQFDQYDEIIVLCKVGKRSKTAQSFLTKNGYLNVRNLEGGLLAIQKLISKK